MTVEQEKKNAVKVIQRLIHSGKENILKRRISNDSEEAIGMSLWQE